MTYLAFLVTSKADESRAQPVATANGAKPPWLISNVRQNMKRAIKVLEEARKRSGDDSPEAKKEFARAIAVLRAIGAKRLPQRVVAAQLDTVDFGPFAEYRLLWDRETEVRKDWHEIALRLSPGDIVLTCRAQFAESEQRRLKKKRPNQSLQPTALLGRG